MSRKFSADPPAAPFTGTEKVPMLQSGINVLGALPNIWAYALNRANHTGTQALSTIAGLVDALAAKAADSAVVKLTGNQTKNGVLTLTSAPVVPNDSWTIAKTAGLQAALDDVLSDDDVAALTGVNVGTPGGTDDTALATAARAAAGVGGTVVFSSGTYVVTGLTASVANQRWLILPGATVKLKNGANTPVIDVTANGVTIEGGGTLDGNRANQTDATTGLNSCVRIASRQRVRVQDLTMRDSLSHCVYIDGSSSIRILNNTISGSGPNGNQKQVLVYDLIGNSSDIRICGNTIDSTNPANGCIAITTAVAGRILRKIHIKGNTCIVGDAGATATLGIELFTTGTASIRDATVTGNIIEGPSGVVSTDQLYGISIGGTTTSATTGIRNVTVAANVVRNCPFSSIEAVGTNIAVTGNTAIASGALSVNAAASVTGGMDGCTIVGNSLLDSVDLSYAIHLGGGTDGLRGCVVSGNVIRNAAAAAAIYCEGVITGASITGNTITDAAGVAMNLLGTFTDSVIADNVFDLTGVASTVDGILIGSTAVARVDINGNTIKGAGRNGIYGLVATSDISIVGNRITTCDNGLKTDAVATRWTVVANTITDNVDRGLIFATAGVDLAIASNTIDNNPGGNYYTVGSTFLPHVINGTDSVLGTFYVGAPTGVTATDIANVEAAIDAATAAPRGGIVQFGPGLYDLSGIDPILLPESGATGKQVTLRGAGGQNGTILYCPTDGAVDEYLIAGSGASSAANGSYKTVIEDLTFWGPQTFTAYAPGRTPCNLSGIMLDTHVKVNRCTFLGFRYGFCAAGNHSTVRDSTFSNGMVGARWTATAGAGGDVLLDNVNLGGNSLASHSIAPTAVAAFHSVRGHVGFAPYGIYFEPGGSAGVIRLYYCVFDATSFEFMGNAMMYDPDQAAGVDEVHWRNCGNFSSNNAVYGLPSSTYHNQVFVHTFARSSFEGGSPNYACTESHFNVSGSLTGVSMDRCLVGMAAAVASGVPFIKGVSLQNQSTVVLRDTNFRAVAVPCHSPGGVTAKTLVERTQFGYARPFAYAGAGTRLPLAGVARNAGTAAGREYVIVVQESADQEILMTGGVDPTGNQVLVPSTATPTSVEPLSWDGTTATLTKPIVGQLYLAVAGSASVRARVRFL